MEDGVTVPRVVLVQVSEHYIYQTKIFRNYCHIAAHPCWLYFSSHMRILFKQDANAMTNDLRSLLVNALILKYQELFLTGLVPQRLDY